MDKIQELMDQIQELMGKIQELMDEIQELMDEIQDLMENRYFLNCSAIKKTIVRSFCFMNFKDFLTLPFPSRPFYFTKEI